MKRDSRKLGLVGYLAQREQGLSQRATSPYHSTVTDIATLLAEERATLPTRNRACELSRQCRSTFLCAFSPDGKRVASTHGDHTVRVSDLTTGRCEHVLTGHPRTPWCIAFHPSTPELLATGCLAGHVSIWDLRGGGREVWQCDKGSVITSLTFHPSEQLLVIATSNQLLFWDWARTEPFAVCKTGRDYERIRWVRFDPLGRFLYTGIANASVLHHEENDSASLDLSELARGSMPPEVHRQYRQIINEITERDAVPNPPESLAHEIRLHERAERIRRRQQHIMERRRHLERAQLAARRRRRVLEAEENERSISPQRADALEEARSFAAHVTQLASSASTSAVAAAPSLASSYLPDSLRPLPRTRLRGRQSQSGAFDRTSWSDFLSRRHRGRPSATASATSSATSTVTSTVTSSEAVPSWSDIFTRRNRGRPSATSSATSSDAVPRPLKLNPYFPPGSNAAPGGSISAPSRRIHFSSPSQQQSPAPSSTISTPAPDLASGATLPVIARDADNEDEEMVDVASIEPLVTPAASLNMTSSSTVPAAAAATSSSADGNAVFEIEVSSNLDVLAAAAEAEGDDEESTVEWRVGHVPAAERAGARQRGSAFRSIVQQARQSRIRERQLQERQLEDWYSLCLAEPPPSTASSTASAAAASSAARPHSDTRQQRQRHRYEPRGCCTEPMGRRFLRRNLSMAMSRASSLGSSSSPSSRSPRGYMSEAIGNIRSEVQSTLDRVHHHHQVNIEEAMNTLENRMNAAEPSSGVQEANTREAVSQPNPLSANRSSPVQAESGEVLHASFDRSNLSRSGWPLLFGNSSQDSEGTVSTSSAAQDQPSTSQLPDNGSAVDMDVANNNPPDATNNNDNNMVDAYNPGGVPNVDPNTVNQNLERDSGSSIQHQTWPSLFPCNSSSPVAGSVSNPASQYSMASASSSRLTPSTRLSAAPVSSVSAASSCLCSTLPPSGSTSSMSVPSTCAPSMSYTATWTPNPATSVPTAPNPWLSASSIYSAPVPSAPIPSASGPSASVPTAPSSSSSEFMTVSGLTDLLHPHRRVTQASSGPLVSSTSVSSASSASASVSSASVSAASVSAASVSSASVSSPSVSTTPISSASVLPAPDSSNQFSSFLDFIRSRRNQANTRMDHDGLASLDSSVDEVSGAGSQLTDHSYPLHRRPRLWTTAPHTHNLSFNVPLMSSPPTSTVRSASATVTLAFSTLQSRPIPLSNETLQGLLELLDQRQLARLQDPNNIANREQEREERMMITNVMRSTRQWPPSPDSTPLSAQRRRHRSVGALSHELDSRIQQLDDRVAQIRRRLSETMASYNILEDATSGYQDLSTRLRTRHSFLGQQDSDDEEEEPTAGASNSDTTYSALRERMRALSNSRRRQFRASLPNWNPPASSSASSNASASGSASPTSRPTREDGGSSDNVSEEIRQDILSAFGSNNRGARWEEGLGQQPAHYADLLDETIQRTSQIHAIINRALSGSGLGAGAAASFVVGGDAGVATNINDLTHRIQRWDMGAEHPIPDLTLSEQNVVIEHCKIHNDATVDMSADGELLAVLVPGQSRLESQITVFSLLSHNLGQALYSKSFGMNAISVSLSPLNNYLLVGLASRRGHLSMNSKQLVAQVYKLRAKKRDDDDSMEHVCDLMHTSDETARIYVSVNSARWIPSVGSGVIYGTNRGDLHICTPGCDEKLREQESFRERLRNTVWHPIGNPPASAASSSSSSSIATQTSQGVRRSASTQTEEPDSAVPVPADVRDRTVGGNLS